MPQNKKHHFVPRFYLKRFSQDSRSINLFNLKSGKKVLGASLRGQCYRDYFYGKEPAIEKALAMTESEIAELFRLFDRRSAPPPFASAAHFSLLIHILMQHGRTTYAADALNEMVDKLTKNVFGTKFREEGIDLEKFVIGMKNAPQFALGTNVSAYPLLMDLRVKLLIDQTSEGFITSDNPVVLYNQFLNFRQYGSNCGFPSKGLQIFFPLDHRKLMVLFDDRVYRFGPDANETIEVTVNRDVYELNTLQMCSANENIYFWNKDFRPDLLHRKARPFLRSNKITIRKSKARPEGGGTSQLIGGSMEDIKTNLSVSFVSLRRSARRWREEFRHLKRQPLVVPRDKDLLQSFRDFQKACKRKEYQGSEFLKFVSDREGREHDAWR